MNTLNIMIGLPGSGKSTWAKNFQKENEKTIVVSSDNFRAGLLGDVYDQTQNSFIIKCMFTVAAKALKEGYDVIYDMINIQREKRIKFVRDLREEVGLDHPFYVKGIYCVTDCRNSIRHNLARDRQVSLSDIKRASKNFDIPLVSRDCYLDEIEYVTLDPIFNSSLNEAIFAEDQSSFNEGLIKNLEDYRFCYDIKTKCFKEKTFTITDHIFSAVTYCKKNIPKEIQGYTTSILYALVFKELGRAISEMGLINDYLKVSTQIFMDQASKHSFLAENETIDNDFIASLIYESKSKLNDIEIYYEEDFLKCLKFMQECISYAD